MREYPRRVYKSKEDSKKVNDEVEEVLASQEGYESHWNPTINELRKNTDREILRKVSIEEDAPKVAPIETPIEKEIVILEEVKKRTRRSK